MKQTVKLSVLVYQADNAWIAQCLERDIAAQGTSIADVVQAFQWTCYAQFLRDEEQGRSPLAGVKKAPQKFFDRFRNSVPLGTYPALPTVTAPAPKLDAIEEEFRVFSEAA